MHVVSTLAEFNADSDGSFSITISFAVIIVVAVAIFITAIASKRNREQPAAATKSSVSSAPSGRRAEARNSSDLTPEAVVNKRFSPTKFRGGYDQDEVDDFLDRVVVEMRRLDNEKSELHHAVINPGSVVPLPKDPAITADEVENITFQPTKFREGYETSHVDEFLDEIVVALRKKTSENDATRERVASQ